MQGQNLNWPICVGLIGIMLRVRNFSHMLVLTSISHKARNTEKLIGTKRRLFEGLGTNMKHPHLYRVLKIIVSPLFSIQHMSHLVFKFAEEIFPMQKICHQMFGIRPCLGYIYVELCTTLIYIIFVYKCLSAYILKRGCLWSVRANKVMFKCKLCPLLNHHCTHPLFLSAANCV